MSTRDLGFLPSWNGSPSNPPGHCWAPKSLSHLSVSRVQKQKDNLQKEVYNLSVSLKSARKETKDLVKEKISTRKN